MSSSNSGASASYQYARDQEIQAWAQTGSHELQDLVPPSRPASFASAHSSIPDRPWDIFKDAQTAAATRAARASTTNPPPQRSTAAWEDPTMDLQPPNEEYNHSVLDSDRTHRTGSSSSSSGGLMMAPSRRGRGRGAGTGTGGLRRGGGQQQQADPSVSSRQLSPALYNENYASHSVADYPGGGYSAARSPAAGLAVAAAEYYQPQAPMEPVYHAPERHQGYIPEVAMAPVAQERRSHHHGQSSASGGQVARRPSDARRRRDRKNRKNGGCC